jgi:lipopolysaccharide export system protein LptA
MSMRQFFNIFFKIIFFFLLLNNVYSENLKNEILVESDSMHIDELNSTSTFSGNVILKYGALSLKSDKVLIFRKNNNISVIQAFGTPASFDLENEISDNDKITGNSEEILFDSEDQTILLSGNANIESIENSISAHSVLFNLSTKSINIKGDSNSSSERVKVKINK